MHLSEPLLSNCCFLQLWTMLLLRRSPPDSPSQRHEPGGLARRVWRNGGQVPQLVWDCLLILTRLPSSETNPHLQIFLDTPPFLWFLYAFWTLTVFYLNASSNSCICTVLSPTLDPRFYHRERKQTEAQKNQSDFPITRSSWEPHRN